MPMATRFLQERLLNPKNLNNMAYGTNKKKAVAKPKPKAQPKPKKGYIESYMDLPMSEKIMKAPGYIVGAPIMAGKALGEKASQIKSDYEKGKRMRLREEYKAAGGKTIREKISEAKKIYEQMQKSKKTAPKAPVKKAPIKKSK